MLIRPKLPVLQRDIRKLPEPTIGAQRRKRTLNDSFNGTPKREVTPSSGENTSGEQTGSSTLIGQSSTAASYLTTTDDLRPVEAKPKRNVKYADDVMDPKTQRTTPAPKRYWNEYDYPEDGDVSGTGDEGYYIYVDPDEKFQWPGTGLFRLLKTLFQGRKTPSEKDDEEAQAILPDSPIPPTAKRSGKYPQSLTSPTTASSADDDDSSSVSETDTTAAGSHTLNRWGQRQRRPDPRTGAANYGTMTRYMAPAPLPPYAVRRPLRTVRLSTVSLSASLALVITVSILAATGRNKQRGEVDAGIMFGIVASLTFALVGVLAAVAGAREAPGDYSWLRWSMIGGFFVGICVGCGVLLGWVLGGFG